MIQNFYTSIFRESGNQFFKLFFNSMFSQNNFQTSTLFYIVEPPMTTKMRRVGIEPTRISPKDLKTFSFTTRTSSLQKQGS